MTHTESSSNDEVVNLICLSSLLRLLVPVLSRAQAGAESGKQGRRSQATNWKNVITFSHFARPSERAHE